MLEFSFLGLAGFNVYTQGSDKGERFGRYRKVCKMSKPSPFVGTQVNRVECICMGKTKPANQPRPNDLRLPRGPQASEVERPVSSGRRRVREAACLGEGSLKKVAEINLPTRQVHY